MKIDIMKKLLFVAFIALLGVMSSCTHGKTYEEKQELIKYFDTVEYKEHTYVMFLCTSFGKGYCGIEHDPDCQNPICKKLRQLQLQQVNNQLNYEKEN